MHQLKEIRHKLGYSIRDFAQLIGCNPSSYQCYEAGRRSTPESVLLEAKTALKRDRDFFKQLPQSVDKHQKKPVPNLAIRGEW